MTQPSGIQPEVHAEDERDRFRLLVNGVLDYAIFMLDAGGHVLTWNTGAQRIKGYSAQEIIGQHFSKFYPPEALARSFPQTELRIAAAEGRFEDEGWRVRKDGSRFWANVIITALRSEDGRLRGFAKVTRDLSKRREQEESLRQSEERFRLLVEGVKDYAIFMLDPNGYVMTWNSGAERIKGYSSDEIIGQHFSKFYPQDALDVRWPDHELQVATEVGFFTEEGWRLRKDGSRFLAHVTITALRGENGSLRGFAKLTRDLTERQRVEVLEANDMRREEMLDAERNARMAAQRAAVVKDEFLATLSHELRTPLNAILGWTQVLKYKGLPTKEEFQRGMEVIERSTRAQAQLIDDLLDLSRIISGRVRLDVRQLALIDVVKGAIAIAEPAIEAKGIRLETVLDPGGGIISGDPARLQQILWNLLSNATKFTPRGGRIQVVLQRVNSHMEVNVSDTGVGIPASFLPHVFERFSQKDTSTTRNYGGLGLGLAISKQLVELHGGTLEAKSPGEGRGSTFSLRMPLSIVDTVAETTEGAHPAHALAEEPSALPSLDGVSVLVVDDEQDARELIQHVLEDRGAVVAVAESGEAALRVLATSRPDVLISDIGMPRMDGFQFLRRFRAEEPKGHRIPAVALTAFARPEDRKRALLAGYQSHMSKPVDMAELVIVMNGLLNRG